MTEDKEKKKQTKQEKLEADRQDRARKAIRDLNKIYEYRKDQDQAWKLKWMFIIFTKLLLCQPAAAAKKQVSHLAEKAGITETRAMSELNTAYNRAIQSSAGLKQEYMLNMVDARYNFKNKTIIQWLDITEQEVDALDFEELSAELIKYREKLKLAKKDTKPPVATLPRW